MIDDIKDLSRAEREKALARRKFANALAKCIIPIIVSAVGMTLFALYMENDFALAFTKASAAATSGRFISATVIMVVLFMGVYRNTEKKGTAVRDFYITVIMVTITFIACIATSRLFSPYAMPIAIATLVLVEIVDKKTATLATAVIAFRIILSVLFTANSNPEKYAMQQVIASVICNSLCACIVNFYQDKHYSRLKFLLVSLIIPLLAQPLVIAFTLVSHDLSLNILWNVIWSYGANFAAALVFMPIVALFEGMFNIADDFRLNELCNLSNPLLKRLASEAPGTFNHSLVVGNLAEACASAIGENPNMARCGAYYHDIGKLKAPIYFSENQSTYNPHDELIPEVSVSMITSHTLFGEILAKKNRLPNEIVAICREHHGTAPVGYFYRKALTLKEEGDLAVDRYTYAGPKPQTKIAAIIMIADTIEAAMRAYMPDNKPEYEARINKLVDEKLELGQFDECPITMGDIAIIKSTIIEALPSIHHSRISYDKKKKSKA